MTLVRFNSEKKNNSLLPGFGDVFDSIFSNTALSDRMVSRVPAVNISETQDHFHIELAAPGLKKDDFKLNLDRNSLSISVEQTTNNNSQDKNYNKREFSYTSFVRSFTLPESADENQIEATYIDGVLKIDIVKREEAKSIARQIEIK